jgi:hypothetical protein
MDAAQPPNGGVQSVPIGDLGREKIAAASV